MFEARLAHGQTLRHVVAAIKDLVVEVEGNIEVGSEGLRIQSMDSSKVALVEVVMNAAMFDGYHVDTEMVLGIKFDHHFKVLELMKKNDALKWQAEDDDQAEVSFEFESPKEEGPIAGIELNLVDIDSDQLEIPDIEYKYRVRMPSAEFQCIVSVFQLFSKDACTISCSKEGIRFSVSGDIGSGNILLRANQPAYDDEHKLAVAMQEPVELSFGLRLLNLFTKTTPLSPSVLISLSPGIPVVVE